MSKFDSQLRMRKQQDNDGMAEVLADVAAAVMGKRLTDALDDRTIAQSAIEAILKAYHLKPVDLEGEVSTAKTVDEQLDEQLRPHGILRRNVKLEGNWYHYASGPMLGTLRDKGTAVALLPNKWSGYIFVDFSTGKHIRINRRTAQLLDEEAVCFYRPLPRKELTIRDLLGFAVEQLSAADLVRYIGAMGLSALVGMLSPKFTQLLFGTVLNEGSLLVLASLAAFMLSYAVSSTLISVFQNIMMERLRVKQGIAVQAAVMNRIVSLPPRFFRQYSSGELYQRAMNIQQLCDLLVNTIGSTGLSSVFSLVYIAQITTFAPALVMLSLGIILLSAGMSVASTLIQMKITGKRMTLEAKTSGLTYAIITGMQKIKLAGAEKRIFTKWARQYVKEAKLDYNPPVLLKLGGSIQLLITGVGTIALYMAALSNGVSVKDYYAFMAAYGMVSASFTALSGLVSSFAAIKPTLDMAKPIMEAVPEVTEGKKTVHELQGAIELSSVSFRYDEDTPNVIDDLSLTIQPGEYLAIVGTTGCGKSTLLRLLLGFETPQKGSIFYDKNEISTLDLQTLRQKIGTVMQDGKLFNGEIYSNILISAPQLTIDDAWEAARIAAIDEDIKRMPMGMHTMIAEGQGGISGGQRQRLMIARAIAPKPKILIFDEATSALDNLTQRKVSEAIDSLNCTRIVVAHRLSTIRHCDRIIVLDKGHVAEDGTYDELMAKNGLFAELVALQQVNSGNTPGAQ